MIYINNELVKNSDQKSTNGAKEKGHGNGWEDFLEIFKDHLNPNKTINPARPIIIKYVDAKIQDDKDNPGRKIMPPSISMSYCATTNINGSGAQVRYSPNPPQKLSNGEFKWTVVSEDVDRGYLAITDVDKAFFFWKYSMQNEANENAPEHSKELKIENIALERMMIKIKKQEEATVNARIWNEIKDGGISDDKLRLVANHFMIRGVTAETDINLVRDLLDKAIQFKPSLKQQFLRLTDKEVVGADESGKRKAIVNEAIEKGIIGNDQISKQFSLLEADGKTISRVLFKYEKGVKPNEQKLALYNHIEQNEPETIDAIKERLELASELATA